MYTLAFCIIYCLYCGFMWRLRGGAWATLLHVYMGTTVTRFVSAFLMAVPLLLLSFNWILIPLVTFGLWLGLVMAPYGAFMGMGDHAHTPAKTWVNFFPKLLGFEPYGVKWDFAGMWFCGVMLYMFTAVGYAALWDNWWLLISIPVAATSFAGSYLVLSWIPDEKFPVIPGFNAKEHECNSEILVGIWTGVFLTILTLFA